MHKKLEENVAAKQATELQLILTDVENRKTVHFFHKRGQECIITIREELVEDFEVMTQEQTEGIRRLLAEFEDDQLEMTLRQEAYERERTILAGQPVPEHVNLCDDEQQTDMGPSTQL
mgnify:CR=1 FL=1